MATIDGYIPDAGLIAFAKDIGDVDNEDPFIYIAFASGVTTQATSTTELNGELSTSGFGRVAVTPTCTTNTIEYATTITATGPATVRSIGLFNAPTGGTLGFFGNLAADKTFAENDTYDVTIQIPNTRS